MAPNTSIEEAKAASKRKREADDHGKSKRTKQDKQSWRQNVDANGSRRESFSQKDQLGKANGASEALIVNASVPESKQERHRTKNKSEERKLTKKLAKGPKNPRDKAPKWKLSQPMGGRMLDIDPILTEDELHLILAYRNSIQIYSAADSLLVRKISLPMLTSTKNPENIVAVSLSPKSPHLVWVASSAGRLWLIDWTTGAGFDLPIPLKCDLVGDLAVEAVTIQDVIQDVPFISVLVDNKWYIWACDIHDGKLKSKKVIFSRFDIIENLCSARNGQILVASSRKDTLLGSLKSSSSATFRELGYEFFTLDSNDEITCLDVRTADRIHLNQKSEKEMGNETVVDVVVGCARGAIFFYNDLLPQLRWLRANKKNYSLQPRKFHWHRKAVHAVKWSEDGNYIISGGSESVLVQWQIDTGKFDVLPHLAATIENIVISSRGSSYIIHLDDNSTMILSTAEMKPTSYISGIQTLVAPPPPSKDNIVERIGYAQDLGIISKIPAAVNPLDPTRLLLGVGNGQQSSHSGATISLPLLQTIDLSTIQGIAKQAMTRTHPTDVNMTSKGYSITEPQITHLAYSHDGRWLATVDEWQPPSRDIEVLEGPSSERREVYLKFWTTLQEDQTLELVSRINAPHYTGRDERVLDLAADPKSHRFATIGDDGVVRLWQPAIRQRDGIVVKSRKGKQLESWACARTIHLQENKALTDSRHLQAGFTSKKTGAISFSEDGSMLACAFQNEPGSATYIIDVESGTVIDSVDGLIRGPVQSIRVLSSQLVVLSDDLVTYNIVLDEMSYGIRLNPEDSSSTVPPVTQLAVDYVSGSYAVSFSRTGKSGHANSELAIFDSDKCEPESIHKFPYPIVSLLTSPGLSGYLVVDSAAQVWSISQGADATSVVLAQPLADINLDKEELAETETEIATVINGNDEAPSDDEMELDVPEELVDDDDVYPVVVAPQKLAELFDAAPPFAMPPIEDMFYQVTRLFSTKTTAIGTS